MFPGEGRSDAVWVLPSYAGEQLKKERLMDLLVPDPNATNMAEILAKVLSQAEVEKLMKQLEDAVVGPQQVLELVQR